MSETLMTASIVIDSPLLEVFDYVANADNLKEWVPLYSDVKIVSVEEEGRATKGDRFKARLSLLPSALGRFMPPGSALHALGNPEIEVTVDDVVHGRRLAYRADVGWTTICDFESSGDRTIFTATQSMWSLPGLVSSFWLGPFQALANDVQRRILEGLRRRLEGRAVDPTPRIFFSYRRSDARYVGGRIFDALTAEFGMGTVFRDSNSLLPGGDWSNDIRKAIRRARVVVVHIGDAWEKGLAERIDRTDGLRDELEAALQGREGIPIIPVLTSSRDKLNLYDRMAEIEAGLKPLRDKAPNICKKFNGRLQVQHLREDPDFGRDLERLMRAVWSEFRRTPSEGQPMTAGRAVEAGISPLRPAAKPARGGRSRRAAGARSA